jgi:large subunit ribosomal protein L14
MIQQESRLKVADNTGARELLVIQVMGGSTRRYGRVGRCVVATVKGRYAPGFGQEERCRQGRDRALRQRMAPNDGSYIRFDDNAAVILDTDGKNPKGTRIFGPVARELREKGL